MGRWDSDRTRRVLLLLVPGAAAVYLAFRSGGAAAGVAAIFAVACLGILLWRATPGSLDANVVSRLGDVLLLILPGALVAYFSFNAGGFFPETPAFVAIILILILVVRITTADDPFAGFSWPLAVATCAMAGFCGWILLSATWSDAPSRALIEFDRSLVYLLALVLFGSVPRNSGSLRWMVRGIALAIVAVAVAGFLTRTLPDVFPTDPRLYEGRLGYPLTYWNAVGILAALGTVLCFHLTSSLREPPIVRVLAAASLPVLAANVLLTFSRGAIFAGFLGLAIYAIVGRPRGLISAFIATVPLGVLAVHTAWNAEVLGTDQATAPAGVDQGHHVALVVALCCAGAALLRFVLAMVLDGRLRRFALPDHLRGRVVAGAWVAGVALVVLAALALDVPDRVDTQYDRFVNSSTSGRPEVARDRLADVSNTGRIEQWDVALDGFARSKLHGQGSGTYGTEWMRERPNTLVVDDAHSLFVEVLEELGLVGLVLLCVVLVTILVGAAPWRGRDRSLHAALLAAALTWAVHAGIDWDWEMPAVTVWLFCVGGAVLALRRTKKRDAGPSSGARLVIGALVLIAGVAPGLVLVSQWQLDDAVQAFEDGDCAKATERASASVRTLEIRPEPYEILGFCDVREGFDRLGVPALERAVDRDPDNWEFRYGLAIVRGSAGLDPREAAAAARRLNPRDPLTQSLVDYADTTSRRKWIAKLRPIAENERLSVVE